MKEHGSRHQHIYMHVSITSVGVGLEVVEHLTTFTSRWFIFDTSFSSINLPRLWIYWTQLSCCWLSLWQQTVVQWMKQSSKIAFALDGFIALPDVVTSNTRNILVTFTGGHSHHWIPLLFAMFTGMLLLPKRRSHLGFYWQVAKSLDHTYDCIQINNINK